MNALDKVRGLIGLSGMAKACGVTPPAVDKWLKRGRLPRTDYTGETDYATALEAAVEGRVTRAELLQQARAA